MKQVLIAGGGTVEVVDVPIPLCDPSGVLIQVSHSLISAGTEGSSVSSSGKKENLLLRAARNPHLVRKVLNKAQEVGVKRTLELVRSRVANYTPTGYSAAGVVVEAGPTSGFHVGERVACAGAGIANHAEFVAAPRNLATRVPDGVPLDQAAFVTLGAIAMQGVRRAGPQFGDTVVVVGLGLIGQLTAQLLRATGCRVYGIDPLASRVEMAMALGMEAGQVPGEGDPVERIMSFTDGYGADAVVITAATPSSEPVNSGFEYLRERGRLVVVGDVGMHLKRAVFYRKELDFFISRSYGPGRYDARYEEKGEDYPYAYVRWTENRNMGHFLRMIASASVKVGPLISRVFPVTQAGEAFAALKADRALIGVLLKYDGVGVPLTRSVNLRLKGDTGPSSRPRLGLIGAGAFARGMHIPNLQRFGDVELRAVCTRSPHNARQAAEQTKAAYSTTDYREILADREIDAVIVATRHNLHAPIVLEALAAGKHVFVEKPMAMTVPECLAIEAAVAEHQRLLTVGFNRRFAPLMVALKENLCRLRGPTHMVFRVNAGFLPKDHWVSDPVEGGGRIVGEGCHWFDLFYWLVEAEPVAIKAAAIRTDGSRFVDRDNLTVTLTFADGSVGTLLYSTLGHASYPKERLEVHKGGASFVMDDYKDMQVFGSGTPLRSRHVDKGQFLLLKNFLEAVRGQAELRITASDGTRATRVALQAIADAGFAPTHA